MTDLMGKTIPKVVYGWVWLPTDLVEFGSWVSGFSFRYITIPEQKFLVFGFGSDLGCNTLSATSCHGRHTPAQKHPHWPPIEGDWTNQALHRSAVPRLRTTAPVSLARSHVCPAATSQPLFFMTPPPLHWRSIKKPCACDAAPRQRFQHQSERGEIRYTRHFSGSSHTRGSSKNPPFKTTERLTCPGWN